MASPTVHVIDDDTHVCRAMSRLLRSYNYNVQSYSSAAHFLTQALAPAPACLVLDIKMPTMNGLNVQEVIAQRGNCVPIIFVSGQADIETSVRAMKAGAIDFLTKPFDDHQLVSAVAAALALSERTLLEREEFKKDQAAFVSLTPREREVCIRIAQGLLNKQVGFELGTTEKTVKAQRARVMQKLRAESLPDVVRLVERLRVAGAVSVPSAAPDHPTIYKQSSPSQNPLTGSRDSVGAGDFAA